MKGEPFGLILGISIGVVIGVFLAILAFYCTRYQKKQINSSSSRRSATIPIRTNGVDTCTVLSDSTLGPDSPRNYGKGSNGMSLWLDSFKKSNVVSASGILEFSYRFAFLKTSFLSMELEKQHKSSISWRVLCWVFKKTWGRCTCQMSAY